MLPARLYAQSAQWPPFTVHGNDRGPTLIVVNGGNTQFTPDIVSPLTDRYRIVLMNSEAATPWPAEDHTADRVSNAILSAATAAGVDRFAYYGYSFGAVMALQVAVRSRRVEALICGGWPPLGAQYRETLAVTEVRGARGEGLQARAFYRSIAGWPEREAVTKLTCARMVFAGTEDRFDVDGQRIRIGPTVAEHKDELQRLGWRVEMLSGYNHSLGARADVIVPLLRQFLDSVTSTPRA